VGELQEMSTPFHFIKKTEPHLGLSTRTSNCLSNLSLVSRDEIKRAIESGKLRPGSHKINDDKHDQRRIRNGWLNARGYGWKSHVEVCQWLGLPAPEKSKKAVTCPHCGKCFKF
jgi:hypothetical protein